MSTQFEQPSPADNDLAEAWKAYERGDFRRARAIARASAGAADPSAADTAEDLLRRTGLDPAQFLVLTTCALFFAWAVWRYAS